MTSFQTMTVGFCLLVWFAEGASAEGSPRSIFCGGDDQQKQPCNKAVHQNSVNSHDRL